MKRVKIIAAVLVIASLGYVGSRWLLFEKFDVREADHPESEVWYTPMGTIYTHPEVFAVYSVKQEWCEVWFAPIDSLHLAVRRRRGVPDPDKTISAF
ncbi:MAG: hypothetical protein AAF488_03960 [Planctomycetota bacterium]